MGLPHRSYLGDARRAVLRHPQHRPAVLPLIGLTHIRAPRHIMPQVAQIIAGIPNHTTQQIMLDLVFKLLDSKDAYMTLEEALLTDPMFENSPYSQRMREVKNEGIEQGIQEGERRMLQRILERRFGELPPALLERLAQVSASHVESLVDVALSADTLDAFVAHL